MENVGLKNKTTESKISQKDSAEDQINNRVEKIVKEIQPKIFEK